MEEEKISLKKKPQQKTSRWWIGTWNNPGLGWVTLMKTFYETMGATYVIAQLEKGETTGTEHIQFTCYFETPKKLTHFAGVPAHMEPCMSHKACLEYCSKRDTRLEGPCEFGKKPKTVNEKKPPIDWQQIWEDSKAGRLEAIPAQQRVMQYSKLRQIQKDYVLMQDIPRILPNRRAYWVWGKPGIGKTYKAYNDFGITLYPKNRNKWWCGYIPDFHKQVLLDDPQKEDVKWITPFLLTWSDTYLTIGETKGSQTILTYDLFIVTCNWSIEQLYDGEANAALHIEQVSRRFISIEMTSRDQDIDW